MVEEVVGIGIQAVVVVDVYISERLHLLFVSVVHGTVGIEQGGFLFEGHISYQEQPFLQTIQFLVSVAVGAQDFHHFQCVGTVYCSVCRCLGKSGRTRE